MGRVTDLPPSFVQSIPGSPVNVNATFGDMLVKAYTTEEIVYPTANAEQYFDLPLGVKRFNLSSRKNSILKGNLDASILTKYKIISPGASWEEASIDPSVAHKIYFSSDQASNIIELTYWV
jgi:hypothetical protein